MDITELPELQIVGIPVQATFEDLHTEVPRAWKYFMEKAKDIPHRKNDIFMDITLMKSGDEYTQLIGAEVERFPDSPDEDLEYITIEAQHYLHHQHEGPLKKIAQTYGEMYEYARNNELKADEFKIDMGYTADDSERTHDLYIRIEIRAGNCKEVL